MLRTLDVSAQSMIHRSHPRTDARLFAFRSSILSALVFQNTAYVILTKLSFEDSRETYIVSTVVVCAEFVKLLTSSIVLVSLHGLRAFESALHEIPHNVVQLCLPSVLYTIQSLLLFEGVRLLDPTVFLACSQLKIFTTACFSFCLLGKVVTRIQIMALCLLVVGVLLVQVENVDVPSGENNMDVHSTMYGLIIVCTAATTSGFAGVYLEQMYKRDVKEEYRKSIWFKNVQLALFSLMSAFLSCYWHDGIDIRQRGFFVGYRIIVMIVVILQATGGLVVAAVMKHLSNLMKCFAAAFSTCICAVVTPLFNHTDHLASKQVTGIILIFSSTFMYTRKPTIAHSLRNE